METEHLKPLEHEMLVCTRCGYCKVVCPSFESILWDSAIPRGRVILAYGLLEGELEPDDSVINRLYQCTTCKFCEVECPSDVRIVDIIESARADLLQHGNCLPIHDKIIGSIKKFGNPYGEEKSRLENFDKEPHKAEIGYFMGCTSGYRELKIANATLSILDKLDTDYTVVNEKCCGSVLQRVGGYEDDLKELVKYNLKQIEDLGIKTLVLSCAGCYRMFKEEYPKFADVNFEVLHVVEYLARQDLNLKPYPKKITYHDPCHLGRHVGVYDAPRELIKKIPEAEFEEMPANRERANCCGGGGGLRSGFPDVSASIAGRRVNEAKFADELLTACPFCVNNLKIEVEDGEQELPVKDIVELIDELL